jgi:hypothetical protein
MCCLLSHHDPHLDGDRAMIRTVFELPPRESYRAEKKEKKKREKERKEERKKKKEERKKGEK